MELWIRSQDRKKLCNAKSFELDNDETGIFCNNYEDGYIFAGKYKTKERALEVLDEIQRILHPTVFMSAEINTDDNNWVENGIIYQKYKDNFNIQELSTYVYEMPED